MKGRGDRQRQDTPKRGRVERDRDPGEPTPGEDLRQQPAERMTDDRRFAVELVDQVLDVVGDLADTLVGENIRVGVGLGDCLGIVGPAGLNRDVAGFLEQRGPAVPARGQQPAVHEHDWGVPGGVRALDLT